MTLSKRFTLSFAIVAFLASPVLFADDAAAPQAAAPTAFEALLQAVVDLFAPTPEGAVAEPGDENQAGPNIIFIG